MGFWRDDRWRCDGRGRERSAVGRGAAGCRGRVAGCGGVLAHWQRRRHL